MLTTDVPLTQATSWGEQEDKEDLGTSIPGPQTQNSTLCILLQIGINISGSVQKQGR